MNTWRSYAKQGKPEAEGMLQRVLVGAEKILGSEHITTLNVVRTLAIYFSKQGQPDNAAAMCLRALHVQTPLGDSHEQCQYLRSLLRNLMTLKV